MLGKINSWMAGMNVLIVDDVHACLPEGLREVGCNVLYLPDADRGEIIANLPGKQVLIIRSKTTVDFELLNAAKDLKIIARAGAGLDNIDLELANAQNITCVNAGEANSDAVGEHALGLLLMLNNNLAKAFFEVRQKIWLREANRGVELAGKTIAIIGYGNTGKAFAQKLSGMGVQILAYDKYLQGFGSAIVKESNWEEIYEAADILSFHVPLTSETKYYLDRTKIAQFKKDFTLLNLSRGKVVHTNALIEALKIGKINSCALDVLENEDLKNLNSTEFEEFTYLSQNEKVILTPHIGGWTKESYHKISNVLLLKLLTFS